MALDAKLIELLACPQCKRNVTAVEGSRALLCESCQLKYPVRQDVPIMLVQEAENLRTKSREVTTLYQEDAETHFRVLQGPDSGRTFHLHRKTCRAFGRGEENSDRTSVLNVALNLAIDERTKSLIMAYVQRQFRTAQDSGKKGSTEKSEQIGEFHREADLLLSDIALSRLHAMLFADKNGTVGILDLVSKNGTFVNGQEVESRLLKKGDVIEVGETKIVFESGA